MPNDSVNIEKHIKTYLLNTCVFNVNPGNQGSPVTFFTTVPVDEALQVIRNKLHNDDTWAERSVLQVEAIMELLEVCLRTTYFQVDDKFFQQKDDVYGKLSVTHR
jgi:hypothetical protein